MACTEYDIPNAILKYYPDFLLKEDADLYFDEYKDLPFTQGRVRGGLEARTTCFFAIPTGDPEPATEERKYWYAGKSNTPLEAPPSMILLRDQIEEVTGVRANACLVNYYADGSRNIGWHSDSETSLVPESTICSLSLGAVRRFDIAPIPIDRLNPTIVGTMTPEQRQAVTDAPTLKINLAHGSLLTMGGTMQRFYKHTVPKQLTIKEPRVNLTFRQQSV